MARSRYDVPEAYPRRASRRNADLRERGPGGRNRDSAVAASRDCHYKAQSHTADPARHAMAVSYFVRYRGAAENPDAFLQHYRTRHVPLLKRFPGIRGLVLHHPVDWRDPFPVNPAGDFLVAQMLFDSAADLNAALASEARARARADMPNFPRFDATVSHQAMTQEIVP
jgi:uncharacterized protein (TIGR02118 family)